MFRLVTLLSFLGTGNAFFPVQTSRSDTSGDAFFPSHRSQTDSSFSSLSSRLFYTHDANREDLENARNRFESMFVIDSGVRRGMIEEAEKKHLFVTASGRRFREMEMKLLKSLEDSDDALDELVHLWTTERDMKAAVAMLYMQKWCSQGLQQEEDRLKEMIQEHPGWAEPYSRLAAVLYYKGPEHVPKAAEMARHALELKPWHFEALQLLVVISKSKADNRNASLWSQMTLPPLHPDTGNATRKEWVHRALSQAARRWDEAEEATKAIKRGELPSLSTFLSASDCWQ